MGREKWVINSHPRPNLYTGEINLLSARRGGTTILFDELQQDNHHYILIRRGTKIAWIRKDYAYMKDEG